MTVELPEEMIGELCREQAKVNGDINVSTPDGFDKGKIDHWEVIKEAELGGVSIDHSGYVYAEFDGGSKTVSGRRLNRRDRWNPPEYEQVEGELFMFINWNLDLEEEPEVWIEFHH